MKKIIALIMIYFILIPDVSAKIFTDNDTTYSVDKFNLMCEGNAQQSGGIIGITKDNYFVPGIHGSTNLFKANEKNCIEMSTKEVLDFYNNEWIIANGYWTDNFLSGNTVDVVSNKFYWESGYLDVSGKNAKANVNYYTLNPNTNMIDYSSNTTFNEGDTIPNGYYEEVTFKFLDSKVLDTQTLDDNKIYVKKNFNFVEVVDKNTIINDIKDKESKILDYRVLEENSNLRKIVKTVSYDKTKFLELENKGLYLSRNPIYNQYTDEIIFVYYNPTTGKDELYNMDAKKITDYYWLYPINEKLSVAMDVDKDTVNTFLDKDFQKLAIDEDTMYYNPYKFEDYIGYGDVMDFERNIFAYKLYEYRILSDKDVEYNNQDVIFKLSLPSRVDKIYLNGNEIPTSSYEVKDNLVISKSYLDKEKNGTYKLTIEYKDKATNEGSITIKNNKIIENEPETNTNGDENKNEVPKQDKLPESPKTSDNISVSFVIVGISSLGLYLALKSLKKLNKN